METVTRATIEQSKGYGVENNLQLENILRTRVESTTTIEGRLGTLGITTYLDIDMTADNRSDAILKAVSIAQLFIQLTSLVYQAEFEINLAGIRSVNLNPNAGMEPFAYLGTQHNIASFEPLISIWEKVALIQEQNSELWDVLQLALEWLHLGATVKDDRSAFLAYRISLEVLMNYTIGDDKNTTVLKRYLDAKKHKALTKVIREILSLCIDDSKAVERIMHRIEDTLMESETEKWATILNNANIPISSKELNDLRMARGGVVHTGISSPTMSKSRIREIVIAYINALLGVGEQNEK